MEKFPRRSWIDPPSVSCMRDIQPFVLYRCGPLPFLSFFLWRWSINLLVNSFRLGHVQGPINFARPSIFTMGRDKWATWWMIGPSSFFFFVFKRMCFLPRTTYHRASMFSISMFLCLVRQLCRADFLCDSVSKGTQTVHSVDLTVWAFLFIFSQVIFIYES